LKAFAAQALSSPDRQTAQFSMSGATEGTIEAYARDNPHSIGDIIPYIPDAKLGFVTDIWSPAPQIPPAHPGTTALVRGVQKMGIQMDHMAGGHGGVSNFADLAKTVGRSSEAGTPGGGPKRSPGVVPVAPAAPRSSACGPGSRAGTRPTLATKIQQRHPPNTARAQEPRRPPYCGLVQLKIYGLLDRFALAQPIAQRDANVPHEHADIAGGLTIARPCLGKERAWRQHALPAASGERRSICAIRIERGP
jgi:hypothetical protein